ncbi:ABC transporter ATP-binding protein [Halioglobus maricola]|uniref:ABC transporter ATP-binding protein n=1 Tax=Halioglobus maricola TaxID=2601894 RepID=A0A5P9NJA8_9GAMM|nr:ABC transporter ATP-binding protein [Halioglobus maricola]QFU75910.1 ABC transporter ATP-binding protein [Halioglobus maricola]
MSETSVDWPVVKRFLNHFKPYKTQVLIGLALIPVSVAFSILFPWLIMQVIDQQLVPGVYDGLMWWTLGLVLVLIGNYLADAIFNYSLQSAAQHAIRDIRAEMFDRVLHFPRRYFDKTPMGVTLTRLTSDLEAISESFTQGLLSMVRDVLITVALLVFLAIISWKLTLVLILIGPVIYYITELLRRRLRDAYLKSRVVLSQGTGYLQESLSGIKTVQLYNAEQEVLSRYQTYTRGFYKAQSKSNLYDSALYSIIEGITTVSMGLIIWYGSREILAATISVGVLVGFINTLDKIFVPIRDFTSQMASIQRAFAAFDHIEEIFQQDSEHVSTQGEHLSVSELGVLDSFETLVFDEVRFRYTETGPWVLNDVSFRLGKGDRIALVGSTGSGKSTILRLLTKTYDNYHGSIKLNGIELSRIPKAEAGKFFSLMQQEVFLFNESIEFNIGLSREGIDRADVVEAARYVYADHFIDDLPGGYAFELQGNGANLSAGQAQLIAFARAIAGGSEVVMLDEATSSVDSVTEQLIQKAIDHVFMEKTVIAIAHRLSTIQHSDQILVLDKGEIIERGSHGELMRQQGFYANLVEELET